MATAPGAAASMRVPSTAQVARALRGVEHDPATTIGEGTVEHFCDRLREAARYLADLQLTDGPNDGPEAFRYLLTLLPYAVNAVYFHNDPSEPMFAPASPVHLLDWGAASPDGVYRRTAISAEHAYRVTGRFGNADYLTIDYRTSPQAFTIDHEEVSKGPGGSFELFLGGERRDHNWWPIPEGTSGLLVREFFTDWQKAAKSMLRIECLDGRRGPGPEHSATRVKAAFDAIGDWILEGGIRYWAERSTQEPARNAFRAEVARSETKLPVYTHGLWDLGPDEALLIELPDPEARFWGLQLASSLWHTLDFANRLTTINPGQAALDDDGVFRLVLAHEDPGIRNWLDTTGLQRGILILRYHAARALRIPATRVVPFDAVGELLPHAEPCSLSQRRAQISACRDGVAHMVCD